MGKRILDYILVNLNEPGYRDYMIEKSKEGYELYGSPFLAGFWTMCEPSEGATHGSHVLQAIVLYKEPKETT